MNHSLGIKGGGGGNNDGGDHVVAVVPRDQNTTEGCVTARG
jgi:hypothetical protein